MKSVNRIMSATTAQVHYGKPYIPHVLSASHPTESACFYRHLHVLIWQMLLSKTVYYWETMFVSHPHTTLKSISVIVCI